MRLPPRCDIKILIRWLKTKRQKKFLSSSYRDLPGYSHPSVDDLRFQVLQFERSVKDYIVRATGSLPNKPLHGLIDELANHPLYPEHPDHWRDFVEEARQLKGFRNNIVHSDFEGLPAVEELFSRFQKANEALITFRLISANPERFRPKAWRGDVLELFIDGNKYLLSLADIKNLLAELHPSSRGKVNFTHGKLVAGKVLDYRYEKITFFIEGLPEFVLSIDEAAVLEDLLISLVGQHAYT